MQNLKKESGLEVYLKDDFKLDLDIKLLGGEFSARTVADMEAVIKDKIEINNDPSYFMYRDIRERADDERIKENRLRYDLTVLLPRMIGSEFNKTYGHYHPSSYPEVYEVISGRALYLLQKPGKNEDEIKEAYLVEVNVGEKAIIPPNFGHITINSSSKPLVMSNWAGDDFSSEYESFEKHQGGGYYITKSKILKNKHYKKLPKLIRARPKEFRQFGLEFGKPMYLSGCKNINKLKFLTHPKDFVEELEPANVFEF